MNASHLFVYGSLKPGGWAHHLLSEQVCNPRPGSVLGELYNIGSYPALRRIDGEEVRWYRTGNPCPRVSGICYYICGDLIKLIDRLDRLECYPSLFDRAIFTVELDDGGLVDALVYFGNLEALWTHPIIESGVWDGISSTA